ncbi:hypothetical protein NKH77_18250 [Streptomyces sp. M19]
MREIERKYETTDGKTALPDLDGVDGVAAVSERAWSCSTPRTTTPGAAARGGRITLRRRTGGDDAGGT